MGRNKKNRNKPVLPSVREKARSGAMQVPRKPALTMRTKYLLLGIVAVLALCLYGESFGHDFAYDDIAVIQGNRFVHRGLGGIGDILKTQYFEGFDPASNARAYRPVSLISYAIEYEFFGLNPHVNHAVNVLIYVLTAIVLLLMLWRLLRAYHWSLAFLTTVFFVVHPVHVDVVSNIKSRDELLGFFHFCLAVLLLLQYLDQPRWWKRMLSLVFFFLALASKETLLTTVACLPLLLYFFRELAFSKIARIMAPYFVLFVIFLLIRSAVLPPSSDTHATMSYLDNPILAARNPSERIGTNIYTMGMYLQTLVFPKRLSADYSYDSIPILGMGHPRVIFWLLCYTTLAILAFKGFRKKRIYAFCILWFFITISIVSSIFILSSNAYADRFLYTPSISVSLALAFAGFQLSGRGKTVIQQGAPGLGRPIAFALMALVFLLAVWKTVSYVPVWKNNSTLFVYNLSVNPRNARMYFNYGGLMVNQAMGLRDEAYQHQKPIDTANIHALAQKGLEEIQKGKAIYARDATSIIQEGNAWTLLGNLSEAERSLRKALQLSPDNRYALTSLGGLLLNTGRYQEAAATWEKINPDIRTAGDYYNLSLAYQALGDQQKANYYKQLSGNFFH